MSLFPTPLLLPLFVILCCHCHWPPIYRDEEVNYFPSRFDPVRNAAPTPMNKAVLSGRRERACIAKENNFQQVSQNHSAWHSTAWHSTAWDSAVALGCNCRCIAACVSSSVR